jgi:hypothetical protein
MKIMIVDDEIVSRMKTQKILSSIGECEAFEVAVACMRNMDILS